MAKKKYSSADTDEHTRSILLTKSIVMLLGALDGAMRPLCVASVLRGVLMFLMARGHKPATISPVLEEELKIAEAMYELECKRDKE